MRSETNVQVDFSLARKTIVGASRIQPGIPGSTRPFLLLFNQIGAEQVRDDERNFGDHERRSRFDGHSLVMVCTARWRARIFCWSRRPPVVAGWCVRRVTTGAARQKIRRLVSRDPAQELAVPLRAPRGGTPAFLPLRIRVDGPKFRATSHTSEFPPCHGWGWGANPSPLQTSTSTSNCRSRSRLRGSRGRQSESLRRRNPEGEPRRRSTARRVDQMAIIDDYASIATELRRIKAEKRSEKDLTDTQREPAPSHRMRATVVGDRLYRRLVSQRPRPG